MVTVIAYQRMIFPAIISSNIGDHRFSLICQFFLTKYSFSIVRKYKVFLKEFILNNACCIRVINRSLLKENLHLHM